MNVSVINEETAREINNDLIIISTDQIKYNKPKRKLKKLNDFKNNKFSSLDNSPIIKEPTPNKLLEIDMLEDIHRRFENHSVLSNELLQGTDLMSPSITNTKLYQTSKTPMGNHEINKFTFPKRPSKLFKNN